MEDADALHGGGSLDIADFRALQRLARIAPGGENDRQRRLRPEPGLNLAEPAFRTG